MGAYDARKMLLKGFIVWVASVCLVYGTPILVAYLYPYFYPESGITPADNVRGLLDAMPIFNYIFFFLTAILAGWWIARIYRKDLSRKLGREVRTDIEATSLSAWMEASRKSEEAEKRR